MIINGMYATGTSLLYRILRADPQIAKGFFEPLHPQLPHEIATHHHYADYNTLPKLSKFAKSWMPGKPGLGGVPSSIFWYKRHKEFLDMLVGPRNLLKFVRLSIGLAWFRREYPDEQIIIIIRDPRATVFSWMNKNLGSLFEDRMVRAFDYYDAFEEARALSYGAVYRQPAYIKALMCWKINAFHFEWVHNMFPEKTVLIRYEDLCMDPQETLAKIYPKEVPREVLMATVSGVGETAWENPIVWDYLEEWKKVPRGTWEKGIEVVKLQTLMLRLGY